MRLKYFVVFCMLYASATLAGIDEVVDYCMDPGEGCVILPTTAILAALEASVIDVFKLMNKSVDVDPEKIGFWLYTKKNSEPDDKFVVSHQLNNISNSYFDKNKNTKIFIHGWGQSGARYNGIIPKAYFKKYDVNLFMVDWSAYSNLGYIKTRIYVVENVAKAVSNFIDNLVNYGSPLSKIHIIGHSLGGHIAGFAGKNIKSGKVHRITALDPAGPLFHTFDKSQRLNSEDAYFVDVIHTDGLGLGFPSSLGTVDFYPNKGIAIQSGCEIFSKRINCSHQQSVEFFAETITSDTGFYARKCDSNILGSLKLELNMCSENDLILMGEETPLNATGDYYLETNKETPFALGRQVTRSVLDPIAPLLDKIKMPFQ